MACFGARGDGKTWGVLGAMVMHAQMHHDRGFPLPVIWAGATDTHRAHVEKTVRSLKNVAWRGAWQMRDQDHQALFRAQGSTLVQIQLFGVKDRSEVDHLRAEFHGLWFEEPAPAAVMTSSSGIDETSWATGITSMRLPSHANVAALTTNYPDEDHWTWQRFVEQRQPGSCYFRIPPGERASAEQRQEWEQALATRPDLLRRLVYGEPGSIAMGPQVAVGFREDRHVADRLLMPVPEVPLMMGWDGGHTPTTVIGQRWEGRVRIYAGLTTTEAGMRQHIEQTVRPWLELHAPWTLRKGGYEHMAHRYDPSLDTGEQADIDQSALARIRRDLGGPAAGGAVSWPGRREPLLALLNMMTGGAPVLQISPSRDTAALRRALRGSWYYPQRPDGSISRDLPQKPNHPWEDLGDAMCYFVGGVAPSRDDRRDRRPVQIVNEFDVGRWGRTR